VRPFQRAAPWCAAAGLAAAALCATLAPVPSVGDALRLAGKIAASAAFAWTAVAIGVRVARGDVASARLRREASAPAAAFAVVTTILVMLFARTPSRLTLNLVGFSATALPLAWVVGRRAGGGAAACAVVALGIFGAGAGAVDATRAPIVNDTVADSPIKWTTGWPTASWVLRHELLLETPLPAARQRLVFPLAQRYEGKSRVYATLNGRDLGPVGPSADGIDVPIPADMLGMTRFTFELRVDRPDPALRVMAFHYGRGATLPGAASQFFDGTAWHGGTYNDATGRRQDGVYIVRVVQS
jgi:hypothetical protein